MGSEALSLCEKQNTDSKVNNTHSNIIMETTQKISLHNYSSHKSNSNLSCKNVELAKKCPLIDKIYRQVLQKQLTEKSINGQKLTTQITKANQNQNTGNLNQLNQQANIYIKYLKRKSPQFQESNRNSKHLHFQKNQYNENLDQSSQPQEDPFYKQYFQNMKSLEIYQAQYICKQIKNDRQSQVKIVQLFSSQKNNKYQKFVRAQLINELIQSSNILIISKQGNYYRGGFKNYKINGKGTLNFFNGVQYKGNFKSGFLQGKGEQTQSDGGHFQGTFKKGKRQGKGQIIWKQIAQESKFKLTQQKQKQCQPRQIMFQGYFKNDKMNGIGHLKTPNYQYWGPFVDNMKQGKGTMLFFPQNTKYQGWFQKDQIQGYGVKYFTNGKNQKGYFGNNSLG